jgi:poly(3-hydroxybutyrate) depolymerase
VKASIGGESKSFPYLAPSPEAIRSNGSRTEGSATLTSQTLGALAKVSAVIDTLKVTATGFAAKSIPITSYDTTVNVALSSSNSGGDDRWGGPGNVAGPSAGCGKPLGTLKSGKTTITTGGAQRQYIIDIPSDYKPDRPYRLFFCFHWYGGSADSIASGQAEFGRGGGPANYAYYGLKPLALAANDPAIFVAPQGLNNGWGGEAKDHAFFDDMLALFKSNLCVDTTRVFATGFSFGSMFSYSLSTNHQKQLRAAVGIAPANWNIWIPTPMSREPIAWMQTTGMSDQSCKWINNASVEEGAKFIGLQRGKDNGCTVPNDIPTTTVGSKTHTCYDFAGCKSGYPVKVCTFDGGHIANVGDGGTSNVGKDSWIPKESWKFFTQF